LANGYRPSKILMKSRNTVHVKLEIILSGFKENYQTSIINFFNL